MPIVNTLAFLFTVIGDWLVDGKVISRSKPQPTLPSSFPYRERIELCIKLTFHADTMAG